MLLNEKYQIYLNLKNFKKILDFIRINFSKNNIKHLFKISKHSCYCKENNF